MAYVPLAMLVGVQVKEVPVKPPGRVGLSATVRGLNGGQKA